jgi:hypothetical protein
MPRYNELHDESRISSGIATPARRNEQAGMGIRFYCPNGHKLNVKAFLAGKRGICPHCDARFEIPCESQIADDAPRLRPQPASPSATAMDGAVSVATAQPAAPPSPVPQPADAYDAIAEAPDAVWYVRPTAGGQFGPARGDVMRQWIAEGRVSTDSMVWREGWPDWRTAGPVFPELHQDSARNADLAELPGLSALENPPPRQTRARPIAARGSGNRKSIALVVCLALLILVLLVVLVTVLP